MSNDIDAETLISLVEQRPTLWDKNLPTHKNRNETKQAWLQVCKGLNENFDNLDGEEKKLFGAEVIKRWVNIRDSYHKSVNKEKYLKKSRSVYKKYIYSDQLQFLKNVLGGRSKEENLTKNEDAHSLAENCEDRCSHQRKRKLDDHVNSKPTALQEVEDRHICFFKGIIPSLNSFTEDEILKFQMGILHLISNIKQSRHTKRAPFDVTMNSNCKPNCSASCERSLHSVNFIKLDPLDDITSSTEIKYEDTNSGDCNNILGMI